MHALSFPKKEITPATLAFFVLSDILLTAVYASLRSPIFILWSCRVIHRIRIAL